MHTLFFDSYSWGVSSSKVPTATISDALQVVSESFDSDHKSASQQSFGR